MPVISFLRDSKKTSLRLDYSRYFLRGIQFRLMSQSNAFHGNLFTPFNLATDTQSKLLYHTHLNQAYIMCEVWLSITDATECRFFATFWTSWSNLTVTLTLLTNYCKHSIHSSLQAKAIFHLFSQHPFLSLTRTSQKVSTSTSHCNLPLLFY